MTIPLNGMSDYFVALAFNNEELRNMKKWVCFASLLSLLVIAMFYINGYVQNRILFDAIAVNDINMAEQALERGAFINCPKYVIDFREIVPTNPTPLVLACKSGHVDLVRILLHNGADINLADRYTGQTPLLAALHGTKANRFSLAMYLIDNGARIDVSQNTSSPFYETLSVLDSDTEQTVAEGFLLFQYLMSCGVDTTMYMTNESPLTFAIHHRNINVARYLIENGYFDVNEKDKDGNTPLIVASKYNQLDIAQWLLTVGADASLTDASEKTAYAYALEYEFSEILALFDSFDIG